MTDKKRKCAFCGRPITAENRSREHVWPQWLLRKLDISEEIHRGVHYPHPWGGKPKSERKHSFDSLVYGLVCADCNNGWMSRLETKVKPVIEDWVFKKDGQVSLDYGTCKNLARWAFKTSAVINYSSNYRQIVTEEHLRSFFHSKELAQGTVVDIGLSGIAQDLTWIQGNNLIVELPAEMEDAQTVAWSIGMRSYTFCLNIGGILLRTTWLPVAFMEVSLEKTPSLLRLYPNAGIDPVVDFGNRGSDIGELVFPLAKTRSQ